jgi:hypothetical protein
VRGGITSDGGESTSAIRRKYLDEVRMCQDGAMDADITNLLFAAALSSLQHHHEIQYQYSLHTRTTQLAVSIHYTKGFLM